MIDVITYCVCARWTRFKAASNNLTRVYLALLFNRAVLVLVRTALYSVVLHLREFDEFGGVHLRRPCLPGPERREVVEYLAKGLHFSAVVYRCMRSMARCAATAAGMVRSVGDRRGRME